MLTHVFFDLYGTLLDVRTDERAPETAAAFTRWVGERFGPEAAAWEQSHPLAADFARMLPPARPHGEPDIGPVLDAHLGALLDRRPSRAEIEAAADAFRACSRRQLALIAGAEQALAACGARAGVVLVSNAQWLFTRGELESSGLGRLLPLRVISSEVGVRKPAAAIFEHALALSGARPAETLHVGNDPVDDVAGAAGAGLRTCLVGPAADPPPSLRPDLRLGSVGELPERLFGAERPAWV